MDALPRKNTPAGAQAAVGVTDNINAPWLRPGDTMFLSHTSGIEPGELGVFRVDGALVCRQYVEDCEGNIYLFAANRARRDASGSAWIPMRLPTKTK